MAMGNPVLLSSTNAISYEPIRPIPFSKQDESSFLENLLQNLVDQTPEILPIHDFISHAKSVCSLGCEIPLDFGEREGRIDNLLVTNDGHLVIVETKLHRNPEAIREVVAQVFEYAMAVQKMTLLDLENRIRRGERGKCLAKDETIRDRAASLEGFSDDFEIALERFQRTGEILLLVVADGIRPSVQRLTHWMNEHGSSAAIRFGLVELRFYELADGKKVVMPRTLLKTIEVSRHVVVVDIKNETTASVSAIVEEAPIGALPSKTRTVKSVASPMTREQLLASLDSTNQSIANDLMEQLESIGLIQGQQPTSSVRYGIEDAGEFLPMFYMYKTGVNAYLPKRLLNLLGRDALTEFRTMLRQIAPFWTDAQMSDPYTIGSIVRYEQVGSNIIDIINVLEKFKIRAVDALCNKGEAA